MINTFIVTFQFRFFFQADLYAGALFIKYAIGIEGSGQEGLYLSILVLLILINNYDRI